MITREPERPSPHSPETIAEARATLADADRMARSTPESRAEAVAAALAILNTDRTARLGLRQTPETPARVITIPLAVFQAGRPTRAQSRTAFPPNFPGDAA